MRDQHVYPVLTFFLYLAILSTTGCGEAPAPQAPPPAAVTVASPAVKTVTRFNEYTGNTAAINKVDIVARVPGILVKKNYSLLGENNKVSRVEKGDVLFEIEHEPYEIAVATAQAEVKRSEALEAAAKSVYDNIKTSFDRGAASDLDLTKADADFKQRAAERMASEAKLAQAELELSYTYVKSPIAGEVSRDLVDVGTYVGSAGATVLTRVTQVNPIYVYFDVSETIVQKYINRAAARGQEVADNPPPLELATSSDEKGTYSHTGFVDWWDRTVDRGTGTIVVRGVLDNEDGSLVPGLFVRVRVPFEEIEDAVLVREDAIGTDLSGKYVLVVEDDESGYESVVKKQPIQLVMRAEDGLYVVDGLSPDAQYITVGIQKVRPGMVVKPERQSQSTPDKPAASPAEPTSEPEPAAAPDGEDA
jgi:RND family efflux transporter MFP subunit